MCILLILRRPVPGVRFLLMHNRDEVISRAVGPLEVRDGILAVFDQEAGGTWMGMDVATGRIASLTNVRSTVGPSKDEAVSRGILVTSALKGDLGGGASSGGETCVALPGPMAGFNLVVAEPGADAPSLLTNRTRASSTMGGCLAAEIGVVRGPEDEGPEGRTATLTPLADGAHCVSNSVMDDQAWPKVRWLRHEAVRALERMRASGSARDAARTGLGEPGSPARAAAAAAAAAAANAGAGSGRDEDPALPALAELVRTLAPLMLATSVTTAEWEASVSADDVAWSQAPRDVELRLQRGPFMAASPGYPASLTTRTVTVAAHTDGFAYFASKDLEPVQRAAAGEPAAGVAGEFTAGEGVADVSASFHELVGEAWPAESPITVDEAAGRGLAAVAPFGGEAGPDPGGARLRQQLEEAWSQRWRVGRVPIRG